MLSRIEVGSKAHVLLWLADKPAADTFEWQSAICATAIYAVEQFGDITLRCSTPDLCELDVMARDLSSANGTRPYQSVTFGALYERAKKTWL